MSQTEKYQWLFDTVVDVTWAATHGYRIPMSLRSLTMSYQDSMVKYFDQLRSLMFERKNNMYPSREDMEQQLYLLWLVFFASYARSKPDVDIEKYLLMRSVWAMRDWVWQQMRVMTTNGGLNGEVPGYGFTLDMRFLMFGSGFYPLSELSPYERYLIFLRFSHDQSIEEMSKTLHKSRHVVGKQLNKTITKLRRNWND
jgi:hypothetical protein